jgi:leader peptidase (prepilin peptidase)/N-methyltransferase
VEGFDAGWWLSPAVLGVLGLLVGSFLNVVIHREPVLLLRGWLADMADGLQDEGIARLVFGRAPEPGIAAAGRTLQGSLEALPALGIATPRSRCPKCGHAIRWYENIPVVSWIGLRGRCSACGTPISPRYPLVELATGALFAAAAWKFGPHVATLAWCAAIALLVAMSFIDLDTLYLPDELTYPLLWLGLVAAALGGTGLPLATAVWGAVAGYGPLWLIAKGMETLLRRPAMGAGDLKLLAALGAWLGWQAVLPVILIASIAGLCVNLPRAMIGGHGRWKQYPFGPFIAGAGLIVMFTGVGPLLELAGVSSLG